jgi:hypothetical protein
MTYMLAVLLVLCWSASAGGSEKVVPELQAAHGEIQTLDLTALVPTMLLMLKSGKSVPVRINRTTTSVVWGNGWKMRLDKFLLGPEPDRLQLNRQVAVRHMQLDGIDYATIHILGDRPLVAPVTSP